MIITEEFKNELARAGYSDEQIAKEVAYLERVALEDAYFAKNPSRALVADRGQEEIFD